MTGHPHGNWEKLLDLTEKLAFGLHFYTKTDKKPFSTKYSTCNFDNFFELRILQTFSKSLNNVIQEIVEISCRIFCAKWFFIGFRGKMQTLD